MLLQSGGAGVLLCLLGACVQEHECAHKQDCLCQHWQVEGADAPSDGI